MKKLFSLKFIAISLMALPLSLLAEEIKVYDVKVKENDNEPQTIGSLGFDLVGAEHAKALGLSESDLRAYIKNYFGLEKPVLGLELEGKTAENSENIPGLLPAFSEPPKLNITYNFPRMQNVSPEQVKTLVDATLKDKSMGQAHICDLMQGNPINIAMGNKYQLEPQFRYNSPGRSFTFQLYYNSFQTDDVGSGPGWRHSFDITLKGEGNYREVQFSDASKTAYRSYAGVWEPIEPTTSQLIELDEGRWRWLHANTYYYFSSQGNLTRVENLKGYGQSLEYVDHKLRTVLDDFGGRLVFTYDESSRISRLEDPNKGIFEYQYDEQGRLIQVSPPSGSSRQYLYENNKYPHYLTGIIEGDGQRYLTVVYDDEGRAVSTYHGEGDEKTDVTRVSYPGGEKRVVNGRAYTLRLINGQWTIVKIEGQGGETVDDSCSGVIERRYYPDGLLAIEINENGVETQYSDYDAQGRAHTVVEAYNTPYQRLTHTVYHPEFNLPKRVEREGSVGTQVVFYQYDAGGNKISEVTTGNRPDGSKVERRKAWEFDDLGRLHIAKESQEKADKLVRTSRNRYYPNTTKYGHERGRLKSQTNALGQVTKYLAYNGYGKATRIERPNEQLEERQYDYRGKLIKRTVTAPDGTQRITENRYDSRGLLAWTEQNGQRTTYHYNAAHKLQYTEDHRGVRTLQYYDKQGNLERTEQRQGDQVLTRTSREYDAKSRLTAIVDAKGHRTEYKYNKTGQRTKIIDAKGNVTETQYDVLGRTETITDALNGSVKMEHDRADRLTTVTDPNGISTAYTYDDLGQKLLEQSADRGSIHMAYNARGQLTAELDAKGQLTQYEYDELGRRTRVTYGGRLRTPHILSKAWVNLNLENLIEGSDKVQFTYGRKGGAQNQLIRIEEHSQRTDFDYTAWGQIQSIQTRLNNLKGKKRIDIHQSYQYDPLGRLKEYTLPGGQAVSYRYHNNGDLEGLYLDGQPLLTQLSYHGLGGIQSGQYGNGIAYEQVYNLLGQISEQQRGQDKLAYQYDPLGNITQQGAETYQYDKLNRLTDYQRPGRQRGYQYDANGNRTALTENQKTLAEYPLHEGTNRMQSACHPEQSDSGSEGSSPQCQQYTYDATGNRTSDSHYIFHYNSRNRLSELKDKSGEILARYQYNYQGQRTLKVAETGEHYYLYTPAGQLQAELNQDGEIQQQIIWLGWSPVAVIDQKNQLHYIHTDHLGTPRMATDQKQAITWQWESTPYGVGQPEENGFTLNLRMPGQYYDKESNLFYNWNRYYDPSTSEYTRPDPLGERSDKQLYRYAGGSPVMMIDVSGLVSWEGTTFSPSIDIPKFILSYKHLIFQMWSQCDRESKTRVWVQVNVDAASFGKSIKDMPIQYIGSWSSFLDSNTEPDASVFNGDFVAGPSFTAVYGVGGEVSSFIKMGEAKASASIGWAGGKGNGVEFVSLGKASVSSSRIECCP